MLISWTDKLSPIIVLGAPVAIVAGLLLVRQPFLCLVVMVSYVQTSAMASVILRGYTEFGFKILTLLALIGLIFIQENRNRAKKQDAPPIATTLYLLLLLAFLISVVLAYDPGYALDRFIQFMAVATLSFLIVALVDTVRRFEIILVAILATTFVSSVVVIYDWSFNDNLFGGYARPDMEGAETGGNRSSGTFHGVATMAATMILCGTTLAAIFLVRVPHWRLFTIAIVVVGSMGIVLNSTRSAALTYLIMALWLVIKLRKHRLFPALLLALVLAIAIVLSAIPAEHWSRMLELLEPSKDQTIYRRLSYHIIGLDLLEQFPMFGVGFGNYPLFFDDYDYRWIEGRFSPEDGGSRQLHNQYFQIAAESGIIGVACYLALLGTCWVGLSRVRRKAATPTIGVLAEAVHFSFASLLIQIAFLANKYNKYLWIYVGLAIALHYINQSESRRLAAAKHSQQSEPGASLLRL